MKNIKNEREDEELEETFKALSNPNRLKIIYILSNKSNKTISVNELAQKMDITQPAASQHLKILKTAHIIQKNKKGNNTYYQINIKIVRQQKECIDSLFNKLLK